MSLKIVFAGTPEFAAAHLQVLLESEHEVVAVYSQPDRPAGRGRQLLASPVKALAQAHNIPVYQPVNFRGAQAVAELQALQADIMVVVAYGLILPQVVLDAPKLGCINVHASLLPRWRGAAPIHRALLAGDTTTGVTIMQMNAGLDTGDMLVTRECPILNTDTSQQLHDRLIELGGPALLQALSQLQAGSAQPESQDDSRATYAHKLEKAEGRINWQQNAVDIERQIRGLTPWPGAFTDWQGDIIRIHQVTVRAENSEAKPGSIAELGKQSLVIATGEGQLAIDVLQMPGKKAMPIADVLNARREQFSAQPFFN